MAKKYLKNEKGIVRAVTSENLQLEKPLLNENYDIEVHNRNMDKIDSAIQEVKGKIDGLELVASNVKMEDGTTVEDTVSANKTSILNNTDLANQALTKANEAFQRGDNVKTQLVDKLISIGVDVSTNNTFEELIEKIGNIQVSKRVVISDNILIGATRVELGIRTASKEYVIAYKFYIGLTGSIRACADLASDTTSITGYMVFNLIRDGNIQYSSNEFTTKGVKKEYYYDFENVVNGDVIEIHFKSSSSSYNATVSNIAIKGDVY